MSIPKRDPSMTMEKLSCYGDSLLDAARKYWEASQKAGIDGAVIWLTSESGELVIFTRGEYRHTLLQNIDRLGASKSFGAGGKE